MPLTALARDKTSNPKQTTSRTRKVGLQDTDGMAVASFVLGLMGLLVGNLLLGPAAIVLSALALWRGTGRRGRAWFGMSLGVADLAVLAALAAVDGTISWNI